MMVGCLLTTRRYDPKLEFCELIIPTVDSVRYTYLLNLLVTADKHVLMTGKVHLLFSNDYQATLYLGFS